MLLAQLAPNWSPFFENLSTTSKGKVEEVSKTSKIWSNDWISNTWFVTSSALQPSNIMTSLHQQPWIKTDIIIIWEKTNTRGKYKILNTIWRSFYWSFCLSKPFWRLKSVCLLNGLISLHQILTFVTQPDWRSELYPSLKRISDLFPTVCQF